MNVDELIKKVNSEKEKAKTESHSKEGLVRLQETMEAYRGEYELIWSDDLLKDVQNRPANPMHMTGLKSFDDLVGGFREHQVITISAHSKHGKTAFGMFLLEKFESLNPVMIPMEQSNEELVEQRFENGYSIPRFLSPKTLAARRTPGWIEQRVVEGIAKYNTKLVLIDHLGYIDNFGDDGRYAKESEPTRIQMVMQDLKNIAKNWNVIIILLVHISQGDEGNPPQNNDLKGSSGILQESDKVIFLWRKNNLKNKMRIRENKTMVYITADRRKGKSGYIGMNFNTKTGQYEDDNEWVKGMLEKAQTSIDNEEAFDNL